VNLPMFAAIKEEIAKGVPVVIASRVTRCSGLTLLQLLGAARAPAEYLVLKKGPANQTLSERTPLRPKSSGAGRIKAVVSKVVLSVVSVAHDGNHEPTTTRWVDVIEGGGSLNVSYGSGQKRKCFRLRGTSRCPRERTPSAPSGTSDMCHFGTEQAHSIT
jgi:hypothetical protein